MTHGLCGFILHLDGGWCSGEGARCMTGAGPGFRFLLFVYKPE